MAEVEQTIIIKKIKKVEGGHHGGAWKVAYADFVTAMMAFFLLMWLISSTSKETKEGIADYFTPTTGLKDAKGIGFEGGEAPSKEGTEKSDKSPVGLIVGQTPQGPIPKEPDKQSMVEGEKESKLFENAAKEIQKAFEDDPNLVEFKEQILVEQTPEGLKIEIVDADKKDMFVPARSDLTDYGKKVLNALRVIIDKMPNLISITGHTDSSPYARSLDYTNWELSSDRANTSRRYLIATGMLRERVAKVVGRADQELLDKQDPKSIRNRRITIILLRGSHFEIPMGSMPASRSLLSVPKVDDTGAPLGVSTPGRIQPTVNELPAAAPPEASPAPRETMPALPLSTGAP